MATPDAGTVGAEVAQARQVDDAVGRDVHVRIDRDVQHVGGPAGDGQRPAVADVERLEGVDVVHRHDGPADDHVPAVEGLVGPDEVVLGEDRVGLGGAERPVVLGRHRIAGDVQDGRAHRHVVLAFLGPGGEVDLVLRRAQVENARNRNNRCGRVDHNIRRVEARSSGGVVDRFVEGDRRHLQCVRPEVEDVQWRPDRDGRPDGIHRHHQRRRRQRLGLAGLDLGRRHVVGPV